MPVCALTGGRRGTTDIAAADGGLAVEHVNTVGRERRGCCFALSWHEGCCWARLLPCVGEVIHLAGLAALSPEGT